MNALRIVGLVILGAFILASGAQTAVGVLRLVLALVARSPSQAALAGAVGNLTGSVLVLALLVWLFRKLLRKAQGQ